MDFDLSDAFDDQNDRHHGGGSPKGNPGGGTLIILLLVDQERFLHPPFSLPTPAAVWGENSCQWEPKDLNVCSPGGLRLCIFDQVGW